MTDTATASLRTGTLADLPGIRFADPLQRADPERAQLVEDALAQGRCVVAVDTDEVLGFAVLNYGFFGHGFVPLLVVAMANRRAGIATRLLQEIEQRCVKRKLFISTNRSNLAAQWLFDKCGFVPSGRIENLDLGDDEAVYFKQLPRRG